MEIAQVETAAVLLVLLKMDGNVMGHLQWIVMKSAEMVSERKVKSVIIRLAMVDATQDASRLTQLGLVQEPQEMSLIVFLDVEMGQL